MRKMLLRTITHHRTRPLFAERYIQSQAREMAVADKQTREEWMRDFEKVARLVCYFVPLITHPSTHHTGVGVNRFGCLW
jgi:hypothetical protein